MTVLTGVGMPSRRGTAGDERVVHVYQVREVGRFGPGELAMGVTIPHPLKRPDRLFIGGEWVA